MDLWQLQIFCRVVELKSFSNAARKVHLSQPTVSSHIRDLEADFGCRLVDRLARGAVPTRAGELLYEYAQRLLALKAETETAMAQFQGALKGRLKIGGSTIPGVYLLPKIVGRFCREYPEVRVSISVQDTAEIIRGTLDGTLEMGIVGALEGEAGIVQEPLIDDEMCLVVRPDHAWAGREKIDAKMLFDVPFIFRETGSGTLKSILKSLMAAGLEMEDLKIAAELGSTQAVIQGIKSGLGVSILSRIAVADALRAGTLNALDISGIDLRRSFYLTWHKGRTASPLCSAFKAFCREWAGESGND